MTVMDSASDCSQIAIDDCAELAAMAECADDRDRSSMQKIFDGFVHFFLGTLIGEVQCGQRVAAKGTLDRQ